MVISRRGHGRGWFVGACTVWLGSSGNDATRRLATPHAAASGRTGVPHHAVVAGCATMSLNKEEKRKKKMQG